MVGRDKGAERQKFRARNLLRGSPAVVYIGLGSNLGDREEMINKALGLLAQVEEIRILKVSRVLETKPVGYLQQPKFLNAVAKAEVSLGPLVLLDKLLAVERRLGRVREKRWGPRTIDLDILIYGNRPYNHPRLKIPHPEIHNRPFILEALKELSWGGSSPSPVLGEGGRRPDEGPHPLPRRERVR